METFQLNEAEIGMEKRESGRERERERETDRERERKRESMSSRYSRIIKFQSRERR